MKFNPVNLLFIILLSVSSWMVQAKLWTLEGLEAIWGTQHSTHPRFMDIRRAEYKGIQNLQGSTASVQ